MDRKTLIGLGLIVAILLAFNLFGPKPDQKETSDKDKDQEQVDSLDNDQDANPEVNFVLRDDTLGNGMFQTDSGLYGVFRDTVSGIDTIKLISDQKENLTADNEEEEDSLETDTTQTQPDPVVEDEIAEETYTLESDLLRIEVSNKGGRISAVYLKDFLSYDDYVAENDNALQLYDDTSSYGLEYRSGEGKIRTSELEFEVVNQTDNSITVESNRRGKTIGFTYTLKEGVYDLDHEIYFDGFTDAEVEEIKFSADFYLLSTEKYFPNEKRQATVYWQYEGEGYDYITHDNESMEEDIEWICFRSTFFTSIVSNENGFGNKDSQLAISDIDDEEQMKYIKQYTADVNLGATSASNTVNLNWYFGPVDYDILVEYDNGTEDIVELGTGLFRWINKYAMRPLFMLLLNSGMHLGLAILLLTIIVKLLLSPVNYKMYKSSAMMKVLKPQIEKIAKKYPKKEDAMKKQQETMGLYRETGVSPLAGCIPMLIQMPILFAIFRLFPSAIELRQQSFLWAEDMSTYDSPVVFGFDIPLYGDHMSLFTLLMAATTLLYTHYNSSNMQAPTQEGMPNLKYIMYFFPIMMIFFFNSYSSGLSFYYFISTLMTIGIMFAIKRFMIDDEKILAKIEANQADPKRKKGKSKFQQRLEEAQRIQQEKTKNKRK